MKSMMRFLFAIALACAFPMAELFAQPAKPGAKLSLAERVALLDDADYSKRLAATQNLLSDSMLTVTELQALYEKSRSPEQRHRLADIVLHHFIADMLATLASDSGDGAIGTLLLPSLSADYMPGLNTPAVRVGHPRPGFPAYASLLPGDLIVACNGQPFPASNNRSSAQNSLVTSIKGWPLGKDINLTVLRDGVTTVLSVRVSSLDALARIYSNVDRNGLPADWNTYIARNPAIKPGGAIAMPTINLAGPLAATPASAPETRRTDFIQINLPPQAGPNRVKAGIQPNVILGE